MKYDYDLEQTRYFKEPKIGIQKDQKEYYILQKCKGMVAVY